MWVKAIFPNIPKKSNACADRFGRYIKYKMYEKYFYFLFKFMFLRKNDISEKN